jgi:hypothetical protein
VTDASQHLDELSQVAQIALLQALQALAGAEAAMHEDRILVNLGALYTARALVLGVENQGSEGSVAYLAVQVSGAGTGAQGIMDILTAAESSPHEAILTCVRRWVRYTFPAIRAALSNAESYNLNVGVTQLVVRPDLQWTIFTGDPFVVGLPQDQAELLNALKGDSSLFPGIAGDLVGPRLNAEGRRLHWLKLFVAWADGQKVIECQFDNGEWPELDDLLAENFWFPPLAGDFLSLKQFILIRPD